jgi:hypothetical protein
MADSGRTLVIDPFGKLALCEHWNDKDSFGNIYSDSINHDILNEWLKKDGENIEFCKKNNCRFLPMCTHYNKCEVTDICKNKIHLEDRLEYLKRSILMTYEEYKNRINQIKNGEE